MDINLLYKKLIHRLLNDIIDIYLQYPQVSISSWRRSVEKNKAIGGAEASWHLDGLAIDLTSDKKTLEEIESILIKKRCYKLLANEVKGYLHIQYNFPFISKFERKDCLSHLQAVMSNFSIILSDFLGEEKDELVHHSSNSSTIG